MTVHVPPMAAKFSSCKLNEDTGNILTAAGLMIYTQLFTPRMPPKEKDRKKARYETTILFPKGTDVSALQEAQEEARDTKWTAKQLKLIDVKMPLIETKTVARFREMAEDFPWMIRPKSKDRPQVRGPKGKAEPISEDMEDDEIYNGRWGRVTVDKFAYEMDTSKGVSFGLQNAQLLDHGEVVVPGGGGRVDADDEFDSAVDEEVGDMVSDDI